jgi:hypothetical protein
MASPRTIKRLQTKGRGAASETALFGDGLDKLLLSDRELMRLSRKIQTLQRRLRKACSDEAWSVYLALEAVVNERSFVLVDKWIEARSK